MPSADQCPSSGHPHAPHRVHLGPWGVLDCPGVAEPADSALGRVTVAIATALDGDGGIDAEWLAKVVIDTLVDWSAGKPSPDAAVVDAALAWADDRRGFLLDDPDRRATPADLALIAAVDAWRAEEDDLAGEVDDEPPPVDPDLRRAIINAISPHAAPCQAWPCGWCDLAASQADAVLQVVAEHIPRSAEPPDRP